MWGGGGSCLKNFKRKTGQTLVRGVKQEVKLVQLFIHTGRKAALGGAAGSECVQLSANLRVWGIASA